MGNLDNKMNKQNFIKILGQLLIVAVIGIIFVAVATSIIKFISPNKIEKEDVENIVNDAIDDKIVQSKPSCDNNFESYSNLVEKKKSFQLIKNYNTYAYNKTFINSTTREIKISGKDEIACGYLYIRASKNGKSLDPSYDSIYINPQGFGGHILRGRGIYYRDAESYTEVLISLDSVAYLPNTPYDPDAQNFRIANWNHLLNVNSHLDFLLGLSVENNKALIEEISIAYKCWDPKTGKETNGCQLSD